MALYPLLTLYSPGQIRSQHICWKEWKLQKSLHDHDMRNIVYIAKNILSTYKFHIFW